MKKLHTATGRLGRHAAIILLVFAALFTLAFSASASTLVRVTYSGTLWAKGQTVDTFNGVPARYTTVKSSTGDFCCAGYVKKYYSARYGVTVTNLLTGRTPVASSGSFTRTWSPRPGDVGYQLDRSGSGHWFIVKSVSGSTCTVIEQNWKWTTDGKTYCYTNRTVNPSTPGIKYFRFKK